MAGPPVTPAAGTARRFLRLDRRGAALLILLAWAGALGWLVQRHYLGSGPSDRTPRWPVPPGSAFLSVRLVDRQIGLASVTIDTLPEGLRVAELLTLDLPAAGDAPRRTSVRTEALYSRGLQLRRWTTDLLTATARTTAVGTVLGDTLIRVVQTPRGETPETLYVPLRRPVILPGAIPMVLASRGLPEPGSRLNLEVYDPLDHELRVARLQIAAESLFVVPDSAQFSPTLKRWVVAHSDTVRAWRLDGSESGLPYSMWVDGSGMPVRVEYPLGTIMERSAFEMVQTNFRGLPPAPWDTSRAAPAYRRTTGPVPPRTLLGARAHLAGGGELPEGVGSLEGGWQRRRGDTLWVGPGFAGWPGDSAPARELPVWSLTAPDTTLRAAAGQILRGETRPEPAARALNVWVRRSITVGGDSGRLGPAGTLARGTGRPDERVRLLVALARASGFPARTVWGLVHDQDRWLLAPWAEIWTGTWLPLDPNAGERSDAGRIRLGLGGDARLMDLALRAGRLRFEVLEETR